MCVLRGVICDEAKGLPDDGIAPGTRWDEVPLDLVCPGCGKADFGMLAN